MTKQYDVALNWIITDLCDFSCEYCFFRSSADRTIQPILISPLMSTLKKTGKTFLIIFSGGEPFLVPNFLEACRRITLEHYIGIVSNTAGPDVEKFANDIDPDTVDCFTASLHIKELEKKKINPEIYLQFSTFKRKGI
ncbi:MAG: radical SAM protein [bacterium]